MSPNGHHTYQEIMSQPEVWSHAIHIFDELREDLLTFWNTGKFQQVIFTGCGSTHYLSMMAARLFQQVTGVCACSYPASELVLYPEKSHVKTLLVTISRSGETTETIDAIDVFRENYMGNVLAVTCYSESRLATKADFTIAIDEAREQSVAQTKSFSSMAIIVQLLSATIAGKDTSAIQTISSTCQNLFDQYQGLARHIGENPNLQRFFFLGGHRLYGIAAEAMLKMKEMSLSYSEVYHPLEFRHGPMSMVNEHSLIIGLLAPESQYHETAVLLEMQNRGGTILEIGTAAPRFERYVHIPAALPSWSQVILYLPVLQLIAYYRAVFNQQDPDKPHNLNAVVSLDSLLKGNHEG